MLAHCSLQDLPFNLRTSGCLPYWLGVEAKHFSREDFGVSVVEVRGFGLRVSDVGFGLRVPDSLLPQKLQGEDTELVLGGHLMLGRCEDGPHLHVSQN